MSKLIPRASAAVADTNEQTLTQAPVQVMVPVKKVMAIPLDVANAITREAARDPSDPFVARRLAAHYRSGIWPPADGKAK
jgi:hypothetical protein